MRRQTVARLIGTALLAGSLTGVAAVAPPAGVAAEGGACNAKTYKNQYVTSNVVASTLVTQIGARTLPPGGARKVTTTVATRNSVTAGAKLTGEYGTKLENKLIGSAEVKVGLQLSAAGATTRKQSSKVTESVTNRTGRNQKYVFFRGTTKVAGNARSSYCNAQDGTGGGTIVWREGRVTSFTFLDQGFAQCGAGATGAVPRKALQIGCK